MLALKSFPLVISAAGTAFSNIEIYSQHNIFVFDNCGSNVQPFTFNFQFYGTGDYVSEYGFEYIKLISAG